MLRAWRSGVAPPVLNVVDAQADDAIGLECALPGKELLFRHLIAVTRLLDRDHAARHRCYDRGFATRDPPSSGRGRQFDHRSNFMPEGSA